MGYTWGQNESAYFLIRVFCFELEVTAWFLLQAGTPQGRNKAK